MDPTNRQDRLFFRLLAAACALTLAFGALIAGYYGDLGARSAAAPVAGDGFVDTGPLDSTAASGDGGTAGGSAAAANSGAVRGGAREGINSRSPDSKAGVSRGSIKIGSIFTETGPFDGRAATYSARAYIQMINAQGGVNGRKIELISYDDGYDPTQGLNAARRLVEQDKVFAIVGWLAPNTEPAASEYFAKVGIPVIGGLGVPQEFGHRNFFPVSGNFAKAGAGLARFPCEAGVKHPAVAVVNLSYSDQMIEGFKRGIARCDGVEPVTYEKIDATETNYNAKVLNWRAMGADSILVGLDPMSYVRLFQALAQQNWYPQVFSSGFADSERNAYVSDVLEKTHAINLESELLPSIHMDLPGPRRYVDNLHRYYPGTTIAALAEMSWSGAQVFVEGLRRAGAEPTRESLIRALETFREVKLDLLSPVTYLPEDHDAVRCIEVQEWKSGGWKDVYPDWQCWDYDARFYPIKRPPKSFG
ncbi:MAG: ABC transporter substrate-binding protein [Actinomycetota bacterium]